jgi:trehalose-6-phosphate synthase
MNLVAKEFVASRFDEDGVLILSPFTGAAGELTDALLVNPYATEDFAEAIKKALEMPKAERQRRMRQMREVVRENNIYKWAADIISELVKFRSRDR